MPAARVMPEKVRNGKTNLAGELGKETAASEGKREFWDSRAKEFSEHAASTGYPQAFLRLLKLRKSWTVLDMACGGGTLAVPLAKKVKSVTAVDFSAWMLDIVNKRCGAEGIPNVKTLPGRWEDDWKALGIGAHDVAIASRSLLSESAEESITKLNAVATKAVYISVAVGAGPWDRRLIESVGRNCPSRPDYIYYYNLLYEMGIPANVAFIPESNRNSWGSHEEAFEDQRWMFHEMMPDEEEKIRAYLKRHLLWVKGQWRLPYSRHYSWAVLFWPKDRRIGP